MKIVKCDICKEEVNLGFPPTSRYEIINYFANEKSITDICHRCTDDIESFIDVLKKRKFRND